MELKRKAELKSLMMELYERVISAVHHECLDRIPIDYLAMPETHAIQPDTPVENILAIYETALSMQY